MLETTETTGLQVASVKKTLSSAFVKNIAWIFVSESAIRVTRLLTTIVLAQFLVVADYAIAAIAMASYELVRVLSNNGIGAKIVQCQDVELATTCEVVGRLNWMVAIVMSALLCLSAWPLGDSYNSPDLPWLLMALALSYLIYPFAMVQVYRVQRSNDLRFLGVMNGGVVSMDNLLCAALAVAGCGVWSVVIPKLIVAPLWVIGFRWYAAKQRLIDTGGKGWGIATKVSRVAFSDYLPVLTFSRFVMGAELIKALRNNLDIFIVGKALGLEALGLYAFAKNAGLGISMTLGSAFSTAFYTHICKIRNLKLSARAGHDAGSFDLAHAFRDVLLLCLCVLSPVILLQALLAPYYIPLLFGGRWDGAVLLVTVLCLSAIPRVFADMYLLRVRASGQTRLEFRVSGLAFAVFSALVLVAADQDVMAVCLAMVLSQLIHWLLAIALTDGVNKAS